MSRTIGALVASALGLGLVPAAAGASGFSHGVSAGEITARSAVLWTRSDEPGRLRLQVSPRRSFGGRGVLTRRVTVSASRDNTVRVRVSGLRPRRRYAYRFLRGADPSPVGRFVTAPPPRRTATVSFAYTGDADAQPAPGQTTPFYNAFEVYRRMAAEGNDFNVNIGDTIYSDSEVGGIPPALTVEEKWGKYRQNLAMENLQAVRRSAGMYNHWDDHEFVNDFSRAEHGDAVYQAGVTAFRDYMPVTYTRRTGLFRSFRWGRTLELFFVDARSFRSAKASAGGVCNNPETGQPDLAPTAPQSRRDIFALLIPSLRQPVSQACLDAIRSPERTLLGRRQYDALTRRLLASKATFKVVMNEVPIQQLYGLPYDRWEGYEAERGRLLRFIRARVRNVVFLTTDTHANFFNDVRFTTFPEEGGPRSAGVKEMVTGPAATMTFAREIDATVSRPGAGDLLAAVFLKPEPPEGLGMACAAPDVYSYTQVRVTRRALTLTPKDIAGRPVREKGTAGRPGPRCGPFTIRAR